MSPLVSHVCQKRPKFQVWGYSQQIHRWNKKSNVFDTSIMPLSSNLYKSLFMFRSIFSEDVYDMTRNDSDCHKNRCDERTLHFTIIGPRTYNILQFQNQLITKHRSIHERLSFFLDKKDTLRVLFWFQYKENKLIWWFWFQYWENKLIWWFWFQYGEIENKMPGIRRSFWNKTECYFQILLTTMKAALQISRNRRPCLHIDKGIIFHLFLWWKGYEGTSSYCFIIWFLIDTGVKWFWREELPVSKIPKIVITISLQ